MRAHVLTVIMLGAAVLAGGEGNAQQPAAPPASPLDVVPDKMPFYTPMDLLFRRNAPKQRSRRRWLRRSSTTGR